MKRILLPTDFSDNAYNAIVYALQLFKKQACEFYLLHTYTPASVSANSMIDSYSALSLQKVAQEKAENNLNSLKKRLEQNFNNPEHNIINIARFNMLISEMKLLIEEKGIDLVIMGTKGATGAKEIFLGTHTMYAIKNMKVPVLGIPTNFEFEAPKEILFPTDFKFNPSNKFFELLHEICINHSSRIHVLNSYYGTPLTEDQLANKSFLEDYFLENAHLFHLAENSDVLDAVAQFQNKAKINLITMIHNRHSFFENILFKPVINQLVYHIDVPFLVIPSLDRQ